MATLREIEGASERPADSRIRLSHESATTVIDIPAMETTPIIVAVAFGLSVCLLLSIYIGAMIFFAGRSVLFMAQVSPDGLPVQLRPFAAWLVVVWLFLLGLGALALLAILRPLLSRETLIFTPSDIVHERRFLGGRRRQAVPRENISSFILRRDPQGFVAGRLTLRAGREKMAIAEYAREDEREWLASVGNVLLRNSLPR